MQLSGATDELPWAMMILYLFNAGVKQIVIAAGKEQRQRPSQNLTLGISKKVLG